MAKMPPPIRQDDNVRRSSVSGPELVAYTAPPTTIAHTKNDSNVGSTR